MLSHLVIKSIAVLFAVTGYAVSERNVSAQQVPSEEVVKNDDEQGSSNLTKPVKEQLAGYRSGKKGQK